LRIWQGEILLGRGSLARLEVSRPGFSR